MAITLVTGLPGHGKTLYSLVRWRAEAEKAGRPVFHNSIPGLNIPGWQTWDAKKWQALPAGALLILDEAWDEFPIRGRGEPPEHVGELARHRHLGIDIVLIAQDPMLIDSFVRRLVDRHFHVVRKFGTHFVTIHEYANGVKETVSKGRGDSIKHEWRYPKEAFEWYTSSEQHTVKRRVPMRVWLFLAMPFVLLAFAWALYGQLHPDHVAKQAQGKLAEQPQNAAAFPAGGSLGGSAGSGDRQAKTPLEYAQSFAPRITGLPHTAPVYDEVTRPTDAPYPAACVSMPAKNLCKCYTQQATKLDTPKELCEQIAAGGFFISWAQRVAQAVPIPQTPRENAPGAVPAGPAGIGGGQQQVVASVDPLQDGPPHRPAIKR